MSQPRQGFSKDEKLRKSKEFSLVCRRGRRMDSDHFRLFLLKTGRLNRVGLTVSKKVGGAVARNTIKRRLREVFRRRKSELPGLDLVIIAKRGAADLGSRETGLELNGLIKKIR